ncbi:helicase associated domain-containing protein [Streptomyces griseoincarnatus]
MHPLESNCPFTPDSCTVACQLSREQTPADGAPQGAEPAHSTAEIPYTTQRDAILELPTTTQARLSTQHKTPAHTPQSPRWNQSPDLSTNQASRHPVHQQALLRASPDTTGLWAINLPAAKQYYQREGHLRVPRKHVERIIFGCSSGDAGGEGQEVRELKLGAWISNQRSRAATLSPGRVEQLSTIGMRWP